ncbi:MAG: hypothetical protein O9302_06035 [Cyclobacteriaceae bacterium]|nr:hypothetical protein [Cytophagales bacterium]MCZ8327596.1 hypothetical protein [Cyclobacteriaceae bacterium]
MQSNDFKEGILLLVCRKKDRSRILDHLSYINWKKIYHFNFSEKRNKFFVILKIIYFKFFILRIIKKFDINELYLSSINNYIQLITMCLFGDGGKIVLMADGMQQIIVNSERNEGIYSTRSLPKSFSLLGIRECSLTKFSFLTPYNLVELNDEIIFKPFTKKRVCNLNSSEMGFIGMPVVDLGIVTAESHIKNLYDIKDKFPDLNFVYFAHPSESKFVIDKISKHFNVKSLDFIFEEYVSKENNVPRKIISYYSSVLLNLNLLFDEFDINYFELDNVLRSDLNLKIKLIYNYFEKISSSNFNKF